MGRAIGIDLGQEETRAAVVEDGKVRVFEPVPSTTEEALARAVNEASDALNATVGAAVLVVHSGANQRERQEAQSRGRALGLDVLQVLNRTTAVALAYGHGAESTNLNARLVVVDTNTASCDISIIHVHDQSYEVLATGAWPPAVATENTSEEKQTSAMRGATSRVLYEAGLSSGQLEALLIVGTSASDPVTRDAVEAVVGIAPDTDIDPQTTAVQGAALLAVALSERTEPMPALTDVLTQAIGINKADGSMHVIFKKNQPLPATATRTLTTSKKSQDAILLKLYQGHSRVIKENGLLGTFVFSGIRQAEKGAVKIQVNFQMDTQGILKITAQDEKTGEQVESTIRLPDSPTPETTASEEPTTQGPPHATPAATGGFGGWLRRLLG